jgi:hypothetical protein
MCEPLEAAVMCAAHERRLGAPGPGIVVTFG